MKTSTWCSPAELDIKYKETKEGDICATWSVGVDVAVNKWYAPMILSTHIMWNLAAKYIIAGM